MGGEGATSGREPWKTPGRLLGVAFKMHVRAHEQIGGMDSVLLRVAIPVLR